MANMPDELPDQPVYVTRAELCKLLKISMPTAYRWARQGYGPRAIKFGTLVRYDLAEIDEWIALATAAAAAGPVSPKPTRHDPAVA